MLVFGMGRPAPGREKMHHQSRNVARNQPVVPYPVAIRHCDPQISPTWRAGHSRRARIFWMKQTHQVIENKGGCPESDKTNPMTGSAVHPQK